ncbi:MAG: EAL domain-containing protein [Halioglobus sp.]|nr:EAL domain-containing protein [Halioglobus sp.]
MPSKGGNNRFRLYSGEMSEDRSEHLKLLNELRQAVTRDQIYLEYQPQFDLDTNAIVGLEALVRWEHPDFGVLPPDQFIPIAERSGLIIELGDWILTRACHQAQSWRRRGLIDFPVAVNVSALQFRQLDFVEKVQAALRETGLPGRFLELEVVESMLMIDLDDALEKIEQLDKKLGVKIAIDDFGTGYSSLSYLRQFSAHMIKIDKSFIRDLPGSPDASAIAQAILSMGKTLGMEIIAEGVQTREQAEFLSRIGCQYGQGYYYARPMSVADIEDLLAGLIAKRSSGV